MIWMSGALAAMIAVGAAMRISARWRCACRTRPSRASGDAARSGVTPGGWHRTSGSPAWAPARSSGDAGLPGRLAAVLLQPRPRRISAAGVPKVACCLPCRLRIAVAAGMALIVARLRGDRTPIFWMRAGAVVGPHRGRDSEHLGYRLEDAGQWRAVRGDRWHCPAPAASGARPNACNKQKSIGPPSPPSKVHVLIPFPGLSRAIPQRVVGELSKRDEVAARQAQCCIGMKDIRAQQGTW